MTYNVFGGTLNLVQLNSVCVLLQCDTYKEQYSAAASTAKDLQKQLDEVADLQHAVSETHAVQVSFTYSEVLHRFRVVHILLNILVICME